MKLPIDDFLKGMPVACHSCQTICPLTLAEIEEFGLPRGWQLRLLFTGVVVEGEPAQAERWDVFCPEHRGQVSPRPPGSMRISAEEPGYEL